MIFAAFAVSLVALGFSAYAVIKGEIRARSGHTQRVAIGPAADEARAAIETARRAFDEIVVRGGRDMRFFLDDKEEFHGIEVVLRDNAGRLGDSELRSSIERIAGLWDKAFALAPPGQVVYDLEEVARAAPDQERMRRLADQVEVAHEAQDECAAALRRLNALEAGT